MTIKNKKIVILISIGVALLIVASVVVGSTYAIWKNTPDDQKLVDVPVDEYIASINYIVFRALDEDGNLIENEADAVAYAAVGYTGIYPHVVIPETYSGNDEGSGAALPVTKVLVSDIGTDFQYRFAGNKIITSMIIPASVTEIGQGACSDMMFLASVDILGESSNQLVIGDYAFADCPELNDLNTARQISGTFELYLM